MRDDEHMSFSDRLLALGARLADGLVESFGDTSGEVRSALAAAETGAFLTPLLAARVLNVSGPDARDFLHGQLAADVKSVGPNAQVLSLLLNHKGHALADVIVARVGSGYLLVVDDAKADLVAASLSDHIVFDDVSVNPADGVVLTLQGAGASEVLAAVGLAVPGEMTLTSIESAALHTFVLTRRRSAGGGFDIVLTRPPEISDAEFAEAAAALVSSLSAAGAVLVGEAALAAARVAAMVPAAAREGGEGVLPQEAGMVERLSYRKGCYLGQEIMARIEARGNLKRSLALMTLDGGPLNSVETGSVTLGGRAVGRVGTVALGPDGRKAALVVLRTDVPADADLELDGAPARISRRG